MSCDVGEATERFENELCSFSNLHLRHSSFTNLSFASPKSLALHLRHLASRPCSLSQRNKQYLEGSIEGVDWLSNYQMSVVTFKIVICEIIGAIPPSTLILSFTRPHRHNTSKWPERGCLRYPATISLTVHNGSCDITAQGSSNIGWVIIWSRKKSLLLYLGSTTLFNISGHQRRFLQWAWKVRQILLKGSNFGLRFFYVL